jgi:hypothetical protein
MHGLPAAEPTGRAGACKHATARAARQRASAFTAVAPCLALFAADLAAAPWLGHADDSFPISLRGHFG